MKLTVLAACFLKVSVECKYYLFSHADVLIYIYSPSLFSELESFNRY